jgi:hypothetical protein
MNKQETIKRLQEIENALYYYNAKVVSLDHIGLKKPFLESDISFLNAFLGQRIKDVRDIREELEDG